MEKHSPYNPNPEDLKKLLGLGERSFRKSYYPKLKFHLTEIELFRTMLDNSQDLYILIDMPAGDIIDMNQASRDFWNITDYAPNSLFLKDVAGQECWSIIFKHYSESRSEDQSFAEFITTLCSPDSDCIHAEIHIGFRKLENRETAIFIARDISQHIQLEYKLRESEEKFRALVETLNEMIWEVDANGYYTYVSPVSKMVLGYEPEEMIGKKPFDFMPEYEAERIAGEFSELARNHRAFSEMENINRCKDGSLVVIETSGVPIIAQNGDFIGYRGVDRDITGRKQTESALRQSEAKYRLLFESANDGILLLNEDISIIDCNTKTLDIYGRTREQIIGSNPIQLSPEYQPDGQRSDEKVSIIHQHISDGVPQFFEWQHVRGDGSLINTEVSLSTIKIGNETMLQAVIRDVTDRKKTESALRQSEAKYRLLFESASDCIFLHNEDLTIIDCNNKTLEIFGRTRDQIIGSSPLKLSPETQPDGQNTFEKGFAIVSKVLNGEPQIFEWQHTRGDGTIFDAEVSLGMLSVDNTIILQGLVRDISERKKEQLALQKSERILSSVLHATPIGLGKAINRIIQWINTGFSNMIGYTPEEMLGKSTRMLYKDDATYNKVGDCITQQVFVQGVGSTEAQLRHKDGSLIDTLLCLACVDNEDKSAGIIFSVVNITEQKKAKHEREKLIARLEMQNAELEQYAYTVSHDLKSPLITIEGFTQLAVRTDLVKNSKELTHHTSRILNATTKMRQLLDELLELSRIGRVVNEPENVDFKDILHEALELVSGRLHNTGATVIMETPFPIVYVDRKRIVEVMTNLIENAAKFTAHLKQPEIRIGVTELNGENVFYVRDNGIGLNPEYHEKIFGLFDKLDPASEGSGIGLSIVKRIIELHGRTVWVESDGPNLGCTFYFTLPAKTK
ncbi:MAG: PAS domain-containing sensor histidine kinase [Candidatus Auribacter fodinae]|jgi:PAS domain S-box-containing protein|uniref:histidine kinase n=1 Tax=Candidatus Auribacter fodinae TaxID=2093366 RepID=A0A3A4RGC1_9BACT|nr:MAG: PAS domain-containing sensor histidine kinase [Candidatus Auribacter fodinae]